MTEQPQNASGGMAMGLDDNVYQRLLKERIVWLGSDVRDDNANAICAKLLLLAAEDPNEDCLLYTSDAADDIALV